MIVVAHGCIVEDRAFGRISSIFLDQRCQFVVCKSGSLIHPTINQSIKLVTDQAKEHWFEERLWRRQHVPVVNSVSFSDKNE